MTRSALARLGVLFCAILTFSNCNSCARQPPRAELIFEGAPCDLDEECETGLCDVVPGADERRCLRKCTSGCRPSEVCTTLAEDRLACVPERAGLCGACTVDSDCPYPGDKCLVLGQERFCGRDCAFDGQCPSSFRCADAVTVTGLSVPSQCQPTSGTCTCTAATAGQQQPCEVTNSFGTCVGASTCNPLQGGFQRCTARTPVAELCNGTDDDCDGQTDEAVPDIRCGVGTCERVAAGCLNGRAQTCTPGQPTSEVCNQLDDDCDGQVDDGFDTQTDVANCGACGRTCTLTNAVPKCTTGACAIDRCVAGWVNLDGVAANGCEHPCTVTNNGVETCDGADNDCNGVVDDGFDLRTDVTNCGRCGLTCSSGGATVATQACIAGQCAVGRCVMGRGDCNQLYADGCEENLVSSLTHCGQCGLACAPANATGTCAMGTCRVQQCNPGFRDCNQLASDGCETGVEGDVMNCGACGVTCQAANATSTCQTGTCRFTCLANWYDADNVASNGCEYACIRTNNGVEACDGIDNDCDGAVDEDFNRLTDVNHCGVCNRQCQAANATAVCNQGVCGLGTCAPGRADCNGQYLDGCEVDISSNVLSCGQCNRVCVTANATPACVTGTCRINACNTGFADCNAQATDGCEVNVNTSLAHCGACGRACAPANAVGVCSNGGCAIANCNPGRWNLNGLLSDGCEYACLPSNGGVERCDGLDNDCDGLVDEGFSLSTDPANCGACGAVCSAPGVATATCVASQCQVATCAAGRANCNGAFSDGCEVDTTSSVGHCGACGVTCSVPFATAACVASQCAVGTCNADRANCNGQVADGCEVDLRSTTAHCGACGNACTAANASSFCSNRACGFTCNTGWVNLDGLAANGCEYQCTPTGSDVPDLGLVDADCDGLDGRADSAIFVDAVAGNDGNTGTTRSAPRRTISAALAAAQANGRTALFLSRGTYTEAVTLANGINLYGGYDAAQGWRRSLAFTTIIQSPTAIGLTAQNLGAVHEVQLLTIRAANASGQEPNGDGRSSVAVLAENVGGLTLRGCVLQPGAGTAGASMPTGADGPGALPGSQAFGSIQGSGGFSSCGANGGNGGAGVSGAAAGNRGDDGLRAPSGADPSPGSNGGAGAGCDSSTGNGRNGDLVLPTPAAHGVAGANGSGSAAFGTFTGVLYLPPAGLPGAPGQAGGGGGGGGAGGATRRNSGTFCSSCNQQTTSGGGGGGGGGGCGGEAGLGGRGGGGSFGVVSLNAAVTLDVTQVQTSTGGNGGAGGTGGRGGSGAVGGAGGTGTSISGGCATRTAGNGATGGTGGNGGPGGGGGGGAGGPSVCVVYRGTAPAQTGVSCTTGTPGLGGPGGFGGSYAPNGPDGVASPTWVSP
ncbi:MAG: MopE-related protein [Myxococcaceae bacterium]|nr:MopE-related protein [Myxococcaceae bacterium]